MVPILALSGVAVNVLAILGVGLLLVGNIWTLVVAAQRGILWLIALLLLPIVGLILLFVEPRSRKPFLMALCGIGMLGGALFGVDDTPDEADTAVETALRSIRYQYAAAIPALGSISEGSLESRKARIREWQTQLEAKKAALKPGDKAAFAAFNEEFGRYVAELDKVKADIAAQQTK